MKHFLLSFILFTSVFTFSQDVGEELANFNSTLIDYEVYNDKVVAITRKNREYFMFYEDTKGAKLFESIDIFFATDLEIDCMGNLFLVGVDSSIQLDVSDHVRKVQTLSKASYRRNISTCMALFEESIVRISRHNSLIYEPIDDSIYAINPVLFTIQIWSDDVQIRSNDRMRVASISPNPDATLQDNRALNLRRDALPRQSTNRMNSEQISTVKTSYVAASELTTFQVGDSLWVIDESNRLIFVYDEYGKTEGAREIHGLPKDFKLLQDRQTQEVYFVSNDGARHLIQKVDVNGGLDKGFEFYKGFSKSSLKIYNGHLYFRDSKGVGESIRRVQLN